MYLSDEASESGMYQSHNPYGSLQRSVRRHPPPATSIALDDDFDALTTEAPTDWSVGVVRRGRDYEESISGYQNYVNEMERKLSGEDELEAAEKKASAEALRRANRNLYGSESARGPRTPAGMRTLGGSETPDNARKVSGRRGKIELVESKVMEDGPNRTISLWRERVAESSGGSSQPEDDVRSEANSHAHRRLPSDGSQARRNVNDGQGGNIGTVTSKGGSGKGYEIHKSGKVSYERSEYMVAYHQPTKGGFPLPMYARSESGSAVPLMAPSTGFGPLSPRSRQAQEGQSMLPTRRRTSGQFSRNRNEFLVTYPQTPPHSGGSTTSTPSPNGQKAVAHHRMSPTNTRLSIPAEMTDIANMSKATSTSPVELILSSCDPSLLHISPILSELGIQRLEHLRAIAKLSEETRDREVKQQALKRGVTVVEWAILLDKLQTL